MDDGLRMVQSRACAAWALPGDPTCAGLARRLFRLVAAGLGLESDAIDDGVTMVSELAANTLHVQQRRPAPANPELWLYLRGDGAQAELVCKVFDTLPGWVRGNVPGRTVSRAPADSISGRGLEVVHELSAGNWGHHLSRARLAGTGPRGKAVWFALPAPAPARAADAGAGARPGEGEPVTAGEAMTEVEKDLGTRGFAGKLVRADDPGADMAVLSIASGLTLWCRSGTAWLRAPGTAVRQWGYCDLVEVAEQAVQEYETTIAMAEPGTLAAASRTGALVARNTFNNGDNGNVPSARSAPESELPAPRATSSPASSAAPPQSSAGARRRPWRMAAGTEPTWSARMAGNFNSESFFGADRDSREAGS